MKIKITQYGYESDPYMDSNTAHKIGMADNTLDSGSCALTKVAQGLLGATLFKVVRIDFGNGLVQYRRFDDRAPETEARIDLYNPKGFDKSLPDFADVTLVV